jgi:hypothetical protein
MLQVKKNTQSSAPSIWSWILALFEVQTETTGLIVGYVATSYVIHWSCYLIYITFACLWRGEKREKKFHISTGNLQL